MSAGWILGHQMVGGLPCSNPTKNAISLCNWLCQMIVGFRLIANMNGQISSWLEKLAMGN
jgi:hypothetical protein